MTLIEELKAINASLPAPARRKQIRVNARVTHQRVAEELGVHRITVLRWEKGASEPGPRVRARYAELLCAMERVGG